MIRLEDCGKLVTSLKFNEASGRYDIDHCELVGNDIIAVSPRLLEDADPRFFKRLPDKAWSIKQYHLAFIERDERCIYFKVTE